MARSTTVFPPQPTGGDPPRVMPFRKAPLAAGCGSPAEHGEQVGIGELRDVAVGIACHRRVEALAVGVGHGAGDVR